MKHFIRKYEESLLVVLALVLLLLLVGYFFWGVGYVVAQVNDALSASNNAANAPSFDIGAAQSLDLRGLVTK